MHTNEEDLTSKVNEEVVNTYLNQSRRAVYSAFLLATFLGVSFYGTVPTKNIMIFVLMMFSASAYLIYSSYDFKYGLSQARIDFLKRRQDFIHFLTGAIWGSAFFLLLDAKHPDAADYRVAAIVGIMFAFSASTKAASMLGLMSFVASLSALTAIYFLSNFNAYHWWFFGLIGLVFSCWNFGSIANKYVIGNIKNKLFADAYINKLTLLNEENEAANQQLTLKNNEMQLLQTQLQRLALYDDLTGLHNRRFILERLNEKLAESKRHKVSSCVVLVDIDHFKKVNDVFGHAAGDDVLRAFAQILTRELREGDLVARYGGEEFLIILPMTEMQAAQVLIERLREAVAQQVYILEAKPQTITASFGVAQYLTGDNAQSIINRADKALYQAKATGRNRVILHVVA
jgi:diguanylate cyclase (GGDEF)-like protein